MTTAMTSLAETMTVALPANPHGVWRHQVSGVSVPIPPVGSRRMPLMANRPDPKVPANGTCRPVAVTRSCDTLRPVSLLGAKMRWSLALASHLRTSRFQNRPMARI